MPYIGKSPQHGNYSKIDDISSGFDGSDATHAIASNSIAITPVRPEALIISINGVIQEPVTDYTVSGTNITFTTAPASGDSFFGVAMGEQLAIGTPSDATITSAKLSGDLQTPGNLTIAGTTPTLTVGDAGAEDAKIIFDGNAQDYHLGLQDVGDKLVLGLGSTLGTTTHMSFDSSGRVLTPLQPYFQTTNALESNVTGDGTTYTASFGTETHDIGGNFAANKFTCPVTGVYLFTTKIFLYGIVASSSLYGNITLIHTFSGDTAAHTLWFGDPGDNSTDNYHCVTSPLLLEMTASDTAHITVNITGGSKVVDLDGPGNRLFCGLLVSGS